jgi:hypothetical protein
MSQTATTVGTFTPNATYTSSASKTSYSVTRGAARLRLQLSNDLRAMPAGQVSIGRLSPAPAYAVTHGYLRLIGDDKTVYAVVLQPITGDVVLIVSGTFPLAKDSRLYGTIDWMQAQLAS